MAKFLVALTTLCVFGAVLVEGFDKEAAIAKFMEKAEACRNEVGASEADVNELVGKKPASTAEGKCLRSCLMKKYGVMDGNGKFVKDVALKHAEMYTDGDANKMKVANEIIDACAGLTVSDDHCLSADEYCKCFKEKVVAYGISGFDV